MTKPKAYSDYTPTKQEILLQILQTLQPTYSKLKTISYIDLTAGEGSYKINGDMVKGSPWLAHNVFYKGLEKGQKYQPIFFENDFSRRSSLQCTLTTLAEYPEGCFRKDYNDAASYFNKCVAHEEQEGLIYYDPCGAPNFDMLLEVNKALPKMDVLLHFSPTSNKRIVKSKARHVKGKQVRFMNFLLSLSKSFGYIHPPYENAFNWTFLLATENEITPPAGFVSIFSKEGLELIQTANYTQLERSDGMELMQDTIKQGFFLHCES
jgi:three-Cys-motif partner protein